MNSKKLNVKRLIIFFVIVLILLVAGFVSFFFYKLSPVDKNAEVETYNVSLGKGFYEVIDDLENEGYIRSALALKIYSKIKGSISLDAGVYEISKSYSATKIYDILSENNVLMKDEISLTLIEGENIVDLSEKIEADTDLSKEEFLNTINDKEYIKTLIDSYWFLTDDILDENIYYSLEGYLFPDTYRISKDATIKDIIERMLEETKNKLEPYKNDILESEMSIHEIMTLASIIELEGVADADRSSIAGVFINRINDYWTLGSDVTTYYGLKLSLDERDLYQYEIEDCSNKYNTRCVSNQGLPVGPIANPGIESIKASIYPEDNDYYYFVADKYNNVYFSKTYSEHNSTINRLQNEGLWYEY